MRGDTWSERDSNSRPRAWEAYSPPGRFRALCRAEVLKDIALGCGKSDGHHRRRFVLGKLEAGLWHSFHHSAMMCYDLAFLKALPV